MDRLLKKLMIQEKGALVQKNMPVFTQPMLAQLTDNYFSSPEWIFERKLDGERCLVFIKKGRVTLKSRNDKVLNGSYPEIVEAFESYTIPDVILDGEIVAFKGTQTSFEKLQKRFDIKDPEKARQTGFKVYFYAFDLLYFDGYDTTHISLIKRKQLLKNAIQFKNPIRYTMHVNEKGVWCRNQACKKGWEGVIAKKRTSIYEHKRSSNWLKFKCVNEQELVIGGYTKPQGSRIGFGSLLLGYYSNNKLHYAGKVGTGFNDALLSTLYAKLKKAETDTNPFVNYDDSLRGVQWVKPKIVCQVGFTEWTRHNKLRHPRFLGVRNDKSAREVRQE